MARTGSVAVILPTTAYILRLPRPPVRSMIEKGVIVALGTDFNPNAYCLSMPVSVANRNILSLSWFIFMSFNPNKFNDNNPTSVNFFISAVPLYMRIMQ